MHQISDFEDMSDEETEILLSITILRRAKTIRTRSDFFITYDEKDFYDRFRLSKEAANIVIEHISSHIKRKTNR